MLRRGKFLDLGTVDPSTVVEQRLSNLERDVAAVLLLERRVEDLEQQLAITQDRLLQAMRNTVADVTDRLARPFPHDSGTET